ncbi:MAG: zinc-dependent metalloprotease family protein [Pirellulaceae bacterium]
MRYRSRLKQSKRLKGRTHRSQNESLKYDSCEPRIVLTTTLFVDFGARFAGGVLSDTVGNLDSTTSGANPDMDGPRLSDGTGANYANGDTVAFTAFDTFYGAGSAARRANIMSLVSRMFEPLDITVVELTAAFQNVNGTMARAASSFADISVTMGLNEGAAENNDAYMIVGQLFVNGTDDPTTFAANGYGGLATGTDIGGANNNDGTALTLLRADYGDNFLASQIAHEAGHLLGLRHSFGNNPSSPPPGSLINGLIHNSDLMSYRAYTGTDFYTRYPMVRGDGNLNENTLSAGPPAPAGMFTPYDQLASDPNIGPSVFEYVTGTGANDIITISRAGLLGVVSVQAFNDTAYTSPITVPGTAVSTFTYFIDLTKPLLVEGGQGNDRFVIDGNLNTGLIIRGMQGTDDIWIDGQGLSEAIYSPSAANDFEGIVSVSGPGVTTNIQFSEFEFDSRIQVEDVDMALYSTSLGAADGLNVINESTSGLVTPQNFSNNAYVPFRFKNVERLEVDTSLGDTATSNDTLLIGLTTVPVGMSFVDVVTGNGDDSLIATGLTPLIHLTVSTGNGMDVVTASEGDDEIDTGNDDDIVSGRGGNDMITTGAGEDWVSGGSGDDTIDSGPDDDEVYGGAGNDTINSGSGDDNVRGDAGNDTIDTGSGNDFAGGDDDTDIIYTGSGNDIARGGRGDDTIHTGDGNDRAFGDQGDDFIYTENNNDYARGGAGQDEIYTGSGDDRAYGDNGDDLIVTDSGNDIAVGGNGDDTLDTGDGNDSLFGSLGNDLLIGGEDGDVYRFQIGGPQSDTIEETGTVGIDRANFAPQPWGTVYSTDHSGTSLTTSDSGQIVNVAAPGMQKNLEIGYNVVPFVTFTIAPTIGVPFQTLAFEAMFVDVGTLSTHTAEFDWGDGMITPAMIMEALGMGTASADHQFCDIGLFDVTVNVTDNEGLVGTDTTATEIKRFYVGPDMKQPGKMALYVGGTKQDDVMTFDEVGSLVRAKFNGEVLGDFNIDGGVYGYSGDGDDIISMIEPSTRVATFEGGKGDDWMKGGDGDDWLFGQEGNDRILGRDGNDRIDGGDGDDSLDGGLGNDQMWGGFGNDKLVGFKGDDQLWGDDGDDQLYGHNGMDMLWGGNGNDFLYGDADEDFLWGELGDDTLYGGTGDDFLRAAVNLATSFMAAMVTMTRCSVHITSTAF